MDAVLKFAYYGVSVISGLLITFFFLSALAGNPSARSSGRQQLIAVVAAVCGYGLLYLGFRLGHLQGQFLPGCGLAVLAVVVAAVVMFGGMLVFGNVHWQ